MHKCCTALTQQTQGLGLMPVQCVHVVYGICRCRSRPHLQCGMPLGRQAPHVTTRSGHHALTNSSLTLSGNARQTEHKQLSNSFNIFHRLASCIDICLAINQKPDNVCPSSAGSKHGCCPPLQASCCQPVPRTVLSLHLSWLLG